MPISLPSDAIPRLAPAAEPATLREAALRAAASRTDASGQATPEAFVKFESMVLQTFMQSILPGDTATVYGGGMAGDMWKSMLAQQLGEVMARRGGIGIADRVLGDHYRQGEKMTALSGPPQSFEAASAGPKDPPSIALVEKMQRDIVRTLGQDLTASDAGR